MSRVYRSRRARKPRFYRGERRRPWFHRQKPRTFELHDATTVVVTG